MYAPELKLLNISNMLCFTQAAEIQGLTLYIYIHDSCTGSLQSNGEQWRGSWSQERRGVLNFKMLCSFFSLKSTAG